MGLFTKKQDFSNSEPFYTLGSQPTIIVIGLGNPGKKYDGTRHNIGFYCIDELATRLDFPKWTAKKELKCWLTQHIVANQRVILVKPSTFMNLSGEAAQGVSHFYKVPSDHVTAIHDELDIPFGQIRTRVGGSSAGHNGVESLIKHLGADFGRVRIGISNELAVKAEGKDFVLGKFTAEEQGHLPALSREVCSIVGEHLHGQPLAAETRSFLI